MNFKSFVREILLENWTIKLAAVLLAVILWLVVRGEPAVERVTTVPLDVLIPKNMQITSERPSTVDVTVRGVLSNMWLSQAPPTCRVDLQGADAGEHIVQLSPDDVHLPRGSGLQVVSVRPARVRLVLEWTTSKEVPVRPVLGELPPGLDVYGAVSTPSQVIISGPRSHVDPIKEAPTQPISLAGQQRSFRSFVSLNINDPWVYVAPKSLIQVDIQLGPHRALRAIRVPIVTEDPSLTVAPSRVVVQVLVPETFKEPLTAENFVGTVSTQGLDSSKLSVQCKPQVRLKEQLDPGIVIQEVQPSEVTIRRKK